MIRCNGNEFWARKRWCLLPATIMQICKCLQICKLDICTTETNIVVLYLTCSFFLPVRYLHNNNFKRTAYTQFYLDKSFSLKESTLKTYENLNRRLWGASPNLRRKKWKSTMDLTWLFSSPEKQIRNESPVPSIAKRSDCFACFGKSNASEGCFCYSARMTLKNKNTMTNDFNIICAYIF